jgi:signal peptidase I
VGRKQRKSEPSILKDDTRVQPPADQIGQVWACRLLSAGTSDGKPLQIVPIVDEQSKECLATLVNRSISPQDVTDRFYDLFVLRGAPECIRADNGSSSLAEAIDDWLRQTGADTRMVKGGSSDGHVGEALSGKLRDELIDKTTFATLQEARAAIEGWRETYNGELPHKATSSEEPGQSSGPQNLIGGTAPVPTPPLQHSHGDEGDDVQTVPRCEAPGGQLDPAPAPGLTESSRRGAKSRRPGPSPDAPAGEPEGGRSMPQHGSSGGPPEPTAAPGLPKPSRRGAKSRRPVASRDSPADGADAGHPVGEHDSLVGQVELQQDPGLPGSLGQGAETGHSVSPQGSFPIETEAVQTVPQNGTPAAELELHETPGLPGSPSQGNELHQSDRIRLPDGDGFDVIQSIPQRDPLVGQLELRQTPGLPETPGQGAETPQSIPPDELEAIRSMPKLNSPVDQPELHEAPGIPDTPSQGTKPAQPVPSGGSPADGLETVQSIPQHGSLAGQVKPSATTVSARSLLKRTREYQSIPSGDSGGSKAATHRSFFSIPKWAIVMKQTEPSLGPSPQGRRVMTPGSRVKKSLVRASEWVGIATVALLVIVAVLTLVAPYFGWRVDTVVSGSMEPELNVGSVVITRPLNVGKIGIGDVITFRSPASGEMTSHRVMVVEDGPSFRTGTVADGEADSFVVPAHEVDGRVCLHVPLAGYLLQRLVTPTGLLLLFLFGFAIAVAEIGSMFEFRRKEPSEDGPEA